jgi:hypothetical protein
VAGAVVEEELGGVAKFLYRLFFVLRSRGNGSDKVDGCFEFTVYEAR